MLLNPPMLNPKLFVAISLISRKTWNNLVVKCAVLFLVGISGSCSAHKRKYFVGYNIQTTIGNQVTKRFSIV